MLRSYLLTGIRHLRSQKGYGLINILGLSIGMAAVILVGIYCRGHYRVDRWHEKADRICQVLMEIHTPGSDRFVSYRTDGPLAAALEADYPEVEMGIRMERSFLWVATEERGFESSVLVVEPRFFDLFDFEGVGCDPKSILETTPYAILITEQMIPKYFPEGDPIGKVLSLEGVDITGEYTVAGVMKDPAFTTIGFEFVISTMTPGGVLEWAERWNPGAQHRSFRTWVLLREGVSPERLEPKIQSTIERYLGPADAEKHSYHLQPLKRAHLYWGRDYTVAGYGEIDRLITYALVAAFILVIACVNYVNLATARASRRAREVGLRKVVGAHRRQLIGQFMGESIVTAAAALVVGLGASWWLWPDFAALVRWPTLAFELNLPLAASIALLVLLAGTLAGAYPALYLTRVDPSLVVKGEDTFTHTRSWARRTLVVVQFAASIAIIIGTLSVRAQIRFASDWDLGYKWRNVIEVPILWVSRNIAEGREHALSFRYPTVMQAFLEHPNVLDAAATRFPQGAFLNQGLHEVEGSSEDWNFGIQDTDENFFAFNDIEILAGSLYRNRTETLDSGETIFVGRRYEEYILNAKAVEQIGWATDDPNPYAAAIGRRIGPKGRDLGILVGVCEDYHARSLHHPVVPIAFNLNPGGLKYVQLQLGPGDREETLKHVERVWKQFIPSRPFKYHALETTVEEWNLWDERMLSETLDVAAPLAIFVSCLGLLGLVSYTAETRMKEIGIRKVLGAGTSAIVRTLTSDFARLILIANLIAWPIAWWAVDDWLDNFVFRMDLGATVFLVTGLLSFVAAGAMVAWHTLRAARRQPVDTIRR